MRAPIALFVYNRPEHTRRTIEALARNHGAGDSDLFVFADAPKSAAAEPGVAAVRALLRTVTGFRSINVIERDRNWGVDASIVDGVSRLVEAHDRVIVLEDDLVTSPWFLPYMEHALAAYADEPRVMQVSGFMFPMRDLDVDGASFLRYSTCWGWATWRRAWVSFDRDARGYDALARDARRRWAFDFDGAYDYFGLLQAYVDRKLDAWDIRWYLTVFEQDGLTLFPHKSLVHNIGFDGSGVHCGVSDFAGSELADREVRLFPPVAPDARTQRAVRDYLLAQRGEPALRRLVRRLRQAAKPSPRRASTAPVA